MNKQIAPAITKSETIELQTMLMDGNLTIVTSSLTQQSSTGSINDVSTVMMRPNNKSLSDLTDHDRLEMNYHPTFKRQIPKTVIALKDKLNFQIGRSVHVLARALIHESDILDAREKNQISATKGNEAKAKIEKAKKLSAMLNFKAFGCKIREDSLKARSKMAEKNNLEIAKVMHKKKD